MPGSYSPHPALLRVTCLASGQQPSGQLRAPEASRQWRESALSLNLFSRFGSAREYMRGCSCRVGRGDPIRTCLTPRRLRGLADGMRTVRRITVPRVARIVNSRAVVTLPWPYNLPQNMGSQRSGAASGCRVFLGKSMQSSRSGGVGTRTGQLLWHSLLACLISAPAAFAGELDCGSLENAYGPYDYTNPDHRANKIPIVEGAHFQPEIEALLRSPTGLGTVIGNSTTRCERFRTITGRSPQSQDTSCRAGTCRAQDRRSAISIEPCDSSQTMARST